MSEEKIVLVPIQEAPYINWDETRAKKLRMLLVDETRRSIAEKLGEMGIEVSRQNVDRLLKGEAKWINTQHILAICEGFSLNLSDLIPVYALHVPIKATLQLDKSQSELQ